MIGIWGSRGQKIKSKFRILLILLFLGSILLLIGYFMVKQYLMVQLIIYI
jgi:hypothetical protein